MMVGMEATRRHALYRRGLVTGVLVLLVCLLSAGFQASVEEQRVWQTKGIRAAARLTGSFRLTLPPPETDIQGLESLVRTSDEIVIGKVESAGSAVTEDDRSIWSRFRFVVEDSLKGDLDPSDVFHLQIPGGKVEFADGTWAEFKLANRRGSRTTPPELFREPVKDERHVVFARRVPGFAGPPPPPGEPVMQWTGSQQSLLEIGPDGGVTSRGPTGSFTNSIAGMRVAELGRRVRSLVRETVPRFSTLRRCAGSS